MLAIASAAGAVAALAGKVLAGQAFVSTLPAWGVAPLGGAVAASLVALPIASMLASDFKLARRRIGLLSDERDDAIAARPRLVGPIIQGVEELARAWRDRHAEASARAKELEVRVKVAEAERRYAEAVLDTLKDAVIVADGFNELAMANRCATRLLGIEGGNASHAKLQDVLADERLSQEIDEALRSGRIARQRHFEHQLAGGEGEACESVYDVTISALPDVTTSPSEGDGGIGGVVAILRDVSREREISQMKTDFVSQASHELRTPLSSISAYIEMLIDSEAGDEESRQEFYQIIRAETERVTRMIDNMLNISRIEAGIVKIERTEVDFVEVARGVLDTMRPQAGLKSIKLIEKSGPLVYTAQADRDMIQQVITNLVSNAVKYTPEGGRVTVTVENDDATRSVLVGVQDTGLGIPPEAIDRVFDKFFRIENYKRVAKGTGLGLNLVKHVVETVHRGGVGVESEVGMGSRFWFTIPYVHEQR